MTQQIPDIAIMQILSRKKLKDETCGLAIKGFVGLKFKIYTFITEENHEYKKAKGINENFVDDELKHED